MSSSIAFANKSFWQYKSLWQYKYFKKENELKDISKSKADKASNISEGKHNKL